jgi:chorismate mutase
MQQLVETSAQRLAIAEQVALAKWDSGAPVEDAAREAQVIASATKVGEAMGLDREAVSNFFRGQIEANKLVQYSLLADWHRAGKAPLHKPVNLANTIRPKLDHLETQLLEDLAKTTAMRASASCSTEMAKEVGKYVSTHKENFTQLEAIALDRAMAQACEQSSRQLLNNNDTVRNIPE